jgi:hypothetical protein
MASTDRGRDLVAKFVSETDRFRTDVVERALEDVEEAGRDAGAGLGKVDDAAGDAASALGKVDGQADDASRALGKVDTEADDAASALDKVDAAATDAGKKLVDLEGDGKKAGEAVEGIADGAEQTAKKIDDVFDRIKKASKQGADDVDDSSHKAGESLKEFGEEGTDTAREVAASFDGSAESIVDGFQEVAANAAGAFGPIGLAVGVAAAAGLGLYRAQQEKSRAETERLTQALRDLATGTTDVDTAVQAFIDSSEDQGKLLRDLKRDSETLGLSLQTVARARAGDAESIDVVTQRTQELIEQQRQERLENEQGLAARDSYTGATINLSGETKKLADNTESARETQELLNEAIGKSPEALERQQEATEAAGKAQEEYQRIVDGAASTVGVVMADAAGQVAEAYAKQEKAVEDSLAGITKSLDEQTAAARDYADNVTAATQRLSTDAIAYLQTLPDGGRKAFADLRTASTDEVKKLEASVEANQVAQKYAATITANAGGAKVAGEKVGEAVRQGLTSSEILSDSDARFLAMSVQTKLNAQRINWKVPIVFDDAGLARATANAQAAYNQRYQGVTVPRK